MKIYLESGKSFVWQWDTKQRIVLEGYPAAALVHYANCKTQQAPVVAAKTDGGKLVADIPPELMQEPHDITVYVCDEHGTRHCHFISVIDRPRPESYVYEPVEVLRYETLLERVEKIEQEGILGDGSIIVDDGDGNISVTRRGEEFIADDGEGNLIIQTQQTGGAPGQDGFSPIATVTQTADGATISITDKNGTTTATVSNGKDGEDYVLTDEDKQEIAEAAARMVEVPDAGGGGGWVTLMDVELTEAVHQIILDTSTIQGFEKFNLLLINGKIAPQADLASPGIMTLTVLGSEFMRVNLVPVIGSMDRSGTFSATVQISDPIIINGTIAWITDMWNSKTLCGNKLNESIILNTWSDIYLSPGTRMTIKAM